MYRMSYAQFLGQYLLNASVYNFSADTISTNNLTSNNLTSNEVTATTRITSNKDMVTDSLVVYNDASTASLLTDIISVGNSSNILEPTSITLYDTSGNITNLIANPKSMSLTFNLGVLTVNGNHLTNGIATLDANTDITSFTFNNLNLLVGGSYYIRVYNISGTSLKIYAKSTSATTNFSFGNGTNTSFVTVGVNQCYALQIINTGVGINVIGTLLQSAT